MNKIIVSNKNILCDNNDIVIDKNVIRLCDLGEYLVEYVDDGDYSISFIINGNVKIIESSFDKKINIDNHYIIEDGSLEVIKFYNNLSVKENINIDLLNLNSKVDYHFSNICRGIEEYIININHKNKSTISSIINKSIALNNSSLKFTINSNVGKDCVKSVLDQSTRIVTMGECNAVISPNMFIDLDDVSAKHGSIIGTFKEEQLFYLMSKGINYNDSLKLLIRGYLFSNLDVYDNLRQKINGIIDTYWR